MIRAHLRKLASHSLLYGMADVFTNVVNLLLLPVFTNPEYLTPMDYGHYALLLLFGAVAKIVFRLGLDAGFFRVHYVLEDEEARRRLAGTVGVFAAAVALGFLGLVAATRGPLTRALFGEEAPALDWVVLVAADVFAGSFAFVPLSLLRIQDRPGAFSAFAMGRHAVNTVLKLVLVTSGWGVAGILWSDLAATVGFSLALLPIALRHARLAFDRALLREVLAFGLPKVPHGILVQALNLADRKVLDVFVTRAEVGIYHVGYTLGSGVKFATSAFEPAWGPFVYAQVKREGAPALLARVASWAFAAFTFAALAVGLLGREALFLLTPKNPAFRQAAPIVAVVALAYALHGVFLLTSIGIAIERRARYYPAITAVCAAVNIGLNLALVPRWGVMGAAWATVAAYGVMAALGAVLSRRLYPIPYETGRCAVVVLLAAAAFTLSLVGPAGLWPALFFKAALLAAFVGGALLTLAARSAPLPP